MVAGECPAVEQEVTAGTIKLQASEPAPEEQVPVIPGVMQTYWGHPGVST